MTGLRNPRARHLVDDEQEIAFQGLAVGDGVRDGDPQADPGAYLADHVVGDDDEEIGVAVADDGRVERRFRGVHQQIRLGQEGELVGDRRRLARPPPRGPPRSSALERLAGRARRGRSTFLSVVTWSRRSLGSVHCPGSGSWRTRIEVPVRRRDVEPHLRDVAGDDLTGRLCRSAGWCSAHRSSAASAGHRAARRCRAPPRPRRRG